MALNTFCTLWRQVLPFVTIMKPMTDLCAECQQNSTALMRAANTAEEEKSEVLVLQLQYCMRNLSFVIKLVKRAEEHINQATKARSFMRGQLENSKREIQRVFQGSIPAIGSSPLHCSRDITIHFSFDFAQQVCYSEAKK